MPSAQRARAARARATAARYVMLREEIRARSATKALLRRSYVAAQARFVKAEGRQRGAGARVRAARCKQARASGKRKRARAQGARGALARCCCADQFDHHESTDSPTSSRSIY